MENSFLNQWFSGGEVNAICWTLIHSLWIGLVIALLCGIVIAVTRKSAAALRYRLLCSLLVLFVCAIGVTYYLETGPTPPPPPPARVMVFNIQHAVFINQATAVKDQTLLGSVQGFLNQNTSIIFLVWLLFFVLKSLKMVSGLLYIQRIRNYKTHPVAKELKHRIEHLSSQIGIRRVVRLVQSELVKVPVAIGWLKPMILLPMGIAFQLTPEQLDGILWHELAHIRRRDYLVNILQGLVETVFFFNPGLLWLSSLIRTEREACCDDMVLSRMNRKANYLEALLSFGYGEFDQARYAMSLGSGNQLRDRLKRMIEKENKRLNMTEKAALAIGLVALSAFTSLPKTAQHAAQQFVKEITKKDNQKTASKAASIDPEKQKLAAQLQEASPKLSDASGDKKDSISIGYIRVNSNRRGHGDTTIIYKAEATDNHGTIYHFTSADYTLMSMSIDGKRIKDIDLPKYEYIVRLVRQRQADLQRAANDFTQQQLKKLQQTIQPATADTVSLWHLSMTSRSAGGDTVLLEKGDAMDNHSKNYQFTAANGKLILLNINGEKITDSDLPKYQYLMTLVHEKQKPHAGPNRNPGEFVRQSNKPQPPQAPQQPQKPTPPPSLDKMIADVTNDLVNDHVIKDKNGLSTIKLTYSELVVNGVKLPDDVQKKFAEKYYPGDSRRSHDPNYGLWYNAKTHGVALGTFNLDINAL